MTYPIAITTLTAVVMLSNGCAWFGEARAVGKPPEMVLVTTARSSGAIVALSRIASERSSNPEVKQFAEHAKADHEKMIQDVRGLAERRHAPILPVPDDVTETVAAHLRKLSGEEFDREYMKEMVAEHAKMVARLEADTKQEEKDPEIRQWAARQLPLFHDHLQIAESIQQKLTTAADASPGSRLPPYLS